MNKTTQQNYINFCSSIKIPDQQFVDLVLRDIQSVWIEIFDIIAHKLDDTLTARNIDECKTPFTYYSKNEFDVVQNCEKSLIETFGRGVRHFGDKAGFRSSELDYINKQSDGFTQEIHVLNYTDQFKTQTTKEELKTMSAYNHSSTFRRINLAFGDDDNVDDLFDNTPGNKSSLADDLFSDRENHLTTGVSSYLTNFAGPKAYSAYTDWLYDNNWMKKKAFGESRVPKELFEIFTMTNASEKTRMFNSWVQSYTITNPQLPFIIINNIKASKDLCNFILSDHTETFPIIWENDTLLWNVISTVSN